MEKMERKEIIRVIYLYLFSFVGLVLITVGMVRLVDLGLKVYIFKKADQVLIYPEYPYPAKPAPDGTTNELTPEERGRLKQEQLEYQTKQQEAEKERTAANALAMIIVGAPLFLYHWRTVQKDKRS
ncbi:MAG: hypothetical protein A3A80_03795 [Candidatus Terrybacteria bacterium RIFCSPLOWO2_01_FULL_44_24]|nr:MAG: hypothetical protein A3B75_02500 [Candidatus Terrybacteria bacterium RIFCSPHIGHO2_02_FULL_43_14]OHA52013.1 MAG: hypothetical protein A3A80_03795 [Candidatus Terrybacteria bacterium RIFCSPLOWO2_01_FULL_44_24]